MNADPRKAMVMLVLLIVGFLAFTNLSNKSGEQETRAAMVAKDPLFGPEVLLIPASAIPPSAISRVPIPGVAFVFVMPDLPEGSAEGALTMDGLEQHYPGLTVDEAYARAMRRCEKDADQLTIEPVAFAPGGLALRHPAHDAAAYALLIEHMDGWTGAGGALLAMPQPELLVVAPLQENVVEKRTLDALYGYIVENMVHGESGFRNVEGGLKEQPVWYHHGDFHDFGIAADAENGGVAITPPEGLIIKES